jgi:regulator of sirC expression with transglutaminase-like and TPR domain
LSATPSTPVTSRAAGRPGERFLRMVSGPEQDINVVEAALLIARHEYPDLDVAAYVARVDELAEALGTRAAPVTEPIDRIAVLNRFLFDELGFMPNAQDYYDPRNCFLNDVLDRRTGIPISLSVLYIDLGRRIGLPLQGVGFPGHFLVKCAVPDGTVVIDPFSRGVSLGLADLQGRLREVQGGEVSRAIVASLLVAADNREIILRLLRNLKAIYLKSGNFSRALPIMDCIVATSPGQAPEFRDRGMVYQELECCRAALEDFETYLRLAPGCEDGEFIRGRILDLWRAASRLN